MMKTMLSAAVFAVTMGAQAYAPAKSPLMTEWGEKVTPENAWREYPRPQMVRENWECLNGEWDYAVEIETNGLLTYDRKVLKFDPAVLRMAHERVTRAIGR